MSPIMVNVLDHISILPLTKKQVKPRKTYAIIYYFLTIQHPMIILVF